MLVDTLTRLLRDRYPMEARHQANSSEAGFSRTLWSELADLGVIGALFTEESGGFGGTGFDIAAVFEQLGRALVLEPFLTTLMAGRLLELAGNQTELIADIVTGETMVALAHDEASDHYPSPIPTMRAEGDGDSWRLTGTKALVPHVETADRIIVSAKADNHGTPDEEWALYIVDPGASGVGIVAYPMVDGGRGGNLTLENTPAKLLATKANAMIEDATAAGIVALVWEAVGAMEVAKSDTMDYLRMRTQFGVSISSFQALQHRMATILLETEQARSAAINAAAALEGPRLARERAVSAAKHTIGRVGTLIAEEAIQMHGGIGMTWELRLSHYAKRLIMIDHQLGDEDQHLSRFIALGEAA